MDIFHYRQFDIHQEHAAMKVGTDSDLLGTLCEGGSRILDVGTGTGILSLMLAQRYPKAEITAIEIDENAIIDAKQNFSESPWHDRISLHHIAFQEFLVKQEQAGMMDYYDSVVCNPPYFDKSLECPDLSRSRARHSSSLPFDILAQGAYSLLCDGGVFSVCIPPEVLNSFKAECLFAGFSLQAEYQIKTLPHKHAKRYILVHRKGHCQPAITQVHCMLNANNGRSDWYIQQMMDFLTI